VPFPDPVAPPGAVLKRRFWRMFRLLALLSLAVAAIAVLLVNQGDPTIHVNMLIATALGAGLTVLLGTSLMTLVFISADSGHDREAAEPIHKDDE
jgi:hypothetical protein